MNLRETRSRLSLGTLLIACAAASCQSGSAPRAQQASTRTAAQPATPASGPAEKTDVVTLEVGGMTCNGCATKIQHELSQVPGVAIVDVDWKKQQARVVCSASVADTALTSAVRRAGQDYLGFVTSR